MSSVIRAQQVIEWWKLCLLLLLLKGHWSFQFHLFCSSGCFCLYPSNASAHAYQWCRERTVYTVYSGFADIQQWFNFLLPQAEASDSARPRCSFLVSRPDWRTTTLFWGDAGCMCERVLMWRCWESQHYNLSLTNMLACICSNKGETIQTWTK